jgi:methionine biosynthesis protein MetW
MSIGKLGAPARSSAQKQYEHAYFGSTPEILTEERIKKVIDIVSRRAPRALLDVGCGTGDIAMLIKSEMPDCQVSGVDISDEAVAKANNRGITARVCNLDEQPIPFDKASFDLVICGEVIEHLLDPDRLLDEVHRVLRPGGTAVFTTPNLAAWYNRLALLLGFQPFHTSPSMRFGCAGMPFSSPEAHGQHIRVFTLRALVQLLRLHSFEITEQCGAYRSLTDPKGQYHRYRSFRYPYLILGRILSKRPSLADHLILAVKALG